MNRSTAVYAMRSVVETLEPWLTMHLPNLDPVARRRFIQEASIVLHVATPGDATKLIKNLLSN
jgi:hypothetical protein